MKQNIELVPEFIGRIVQVGNTQALIIPKYFRELWGLRKGKKYKVRVIREADTIKSLQHSLGSYFSIIPKPASMDSG